VGLAEGLERLSRVVLNATGGESEQPWLQRISAGVLALLGFLDQEPRWAESLLIEQPFEGAFASDCVQRVHRALAVVLQEGRGGVIVGADVNPPTALIAELVTIATLSAIRASMLRGGGSSLVGLAPALMSSIVVPYLGKGAARADLRAKQDPDATGAAEVPVRAEVVPIRPQRQTLLALRVLASAPLSSNVEIAAAVGMDSKQASKALKTLEQRWLIENARLGLTPREPNAWLLTAYGRRILGLITDGFARTESDAMASFDRARRACVARAQTQACIETQAVGLCLDGDGASVRGPLLQAGCADTRPAAGLARGAGPSGWSPTSESQKE
jgi:DNA-binding MarR family transcriptional regulator